MRRLCIVYRIIHNYILPCLITRDGVAAVLVTRVSVSECVTFAQRSFSTIHSRCSFCRSAVAATVDVVVVAIVLFPWCPHRTGVCLCVCTLSAHDPFAFCARAHQDRNKNRCWKSMNICVKLNNSRLASRMREAASKMLKSMRWLEYYAYSQTHHTNTMHCECAYSLHNACVCSSYFHFCN